MSEEPVHQSCSFSFNWRWLKKHTSSVKRGWSRYTAAPSSSWLSGKISEHSSDALSFPWYWDEPNRADAQLQGASLRFSVQVKAQSRPASGWWAGELLFHFHQLWCFPKSSPFPWFWELWVSQSPTGWPSAGWTPHVLTSCICWPGLKLGVIILGTVPRSHPHPFSLPLFSLSLNIKFESSLESCSKESLPIMKQLECLKLDGAAGPLTNFKNLRKFFHDAVPHHSNFMEPTKCASLVHRRWTRDSFLSPPWTNECKCVCVCVYSECQRKTVSSKWDGSCECDFWRQKWTQQVLLGENDWGGGWEKSLFLYIYLYIHIHIYAHTSIKNDFYHKKVLNCKRRMQDFLGGPVVRNLPANAGNTGSIPGPGRFHMLRGK